MWHVLVGVMANSHVVYSIISQRKLIIFKFPSSPLRRDNRLELNCDGNLKNDGHFLYVY